MAPQSQPSSTGPPPPFILVSAGSNAQGQLGNGTHDLDAHEFKPCLFRRVASDLSSATVPNPGNHLQPSLAPVCHDPGHLPPGTEEIKAVACGGNHTLTLLSRRKVTGELRSEVWVAGTGARGQLGPLFASPPAVNSSYSPVFQPLSLGREWDERYADYAPKLVAASWETSYIVFSPPRPSMSDVVISFGANDFGDLGVGIDTNSHNSSVKGVTKKAGIKGKEAKRKGPAVKEAPSTTGIHLVSFDHLVAGSCALKNATCIKVQTIKSSQHHIVLKLRLTWVDGVTEMILVGWGTARHGQLGPEPGSVQPPSILASPSIIAHPTLQHIRDFALGSQHTVFLDENGRISAFGSNRKGQTDGLINLQDVISIGCTWNATFSMIKDDRGAFPWRIAATGFNAHGQLGTDIAQQANGGASVQLPSFITNSKGEVKIACGSEHVLLTWKTGSSGELNEDVEEVWGWGWNEHGNLGLGTTQDVVTPVKLFPKAPNERIYIHGIWSGCGTSWICYSDR